MEIDYRKSFLELKVIWKDDDMFELKVTASNGSYFGTTQVYDTSDSLTSFAKSLIDYPTDNKVLFHEAGQTNSYAYFAMKFYCLDNAGHIGVQVNLEDNVGSQYRPEEKNKLTLEILVEPNAIDNFQKQLIQLAVKQTGIAILHGRDHRPDN